MSAWFAGQGALANVAVAAPTACLARTHTPCSGSSTTPLDRAVNPAIWDAMRDQLT